MKVNDSNNAAITGTAASAGVQPPTSGPKSGTGGSVASSDQVQLSSLGSHLGALQADSAQRNENVNQLAAVVANGSYSVDSSAVSAAMVAHAGG